MYEAIVKNTVEILCQLPVPFPESRLLAGIVKEYRAPQQEMFMNDNYHYAMGTAYLKLGILGVSEKAEESSKTVETEKQRELLSSIALYIGKSAIIYHAMLKRFISKLNQINSGIQGTC